MAATGQLLQHWQPQGQAAATLPLPSPGGVEDHDVQLLLWACEAGWHYQVLAAAAWQQQGDVVSGDEGWFAEQQVLWEVSGLFDLWEGCLAAVAALVSADGHCCDVIRSCLTSAGWLQAAAGCTGQGQQGLLRDKVPQQLEPWRAMLQDVLGGCVALHMVAGMLAQ
jgi:hypothetical protein